MSVNSSPRRKIKAKIPPRVVSLSIFNNETVAHGISFPSCEEVYIFYWSDCRDNGETKLQHTNLALKDMSSNHNFYLGGDIIGWYSEWFQLETWLEYLFKIQHKINRREIARRATEQQYQDN